MTTHDVPPYVGALLETVEGKLLFQLRDNMPGIFAPGMITTFGGSVLQGEDPQRAALRELKEELELELPIRDVCLWGEYAHRHEPFGIIHHHYIFHAREIVRASLVLKEGQAIIELARTDDREKFPFVPLVLLLLEEFCGNSENAARLARQSGFSVKRNLTEGS